MSTIAVLGSSNSDGNTAKLVRACLESCNGELIDLNQFNITPWDYQGANSGDDFTDLAQKLIGASDIIFATPVYWYSMSAQMKIFFDRFSDLISRNKPLGRALAGRRTWLISTGSDEELPAEFELPFRRTSDYFDMIYSGSIYLQVTDYGSPSEKSYSEAATLGTKIAEQGGDGDAEEAV